MGFSSHGPLPCYDAGLSRVTLLLYSAREATGLPTALSTSCLVAPRVLILAQRRCRLQGCCARFVSPGPRDARAPGPWSKRGSWGGGEGGWEGTRLKPGLNYFPLSCSPGMRAPCKALTILILSLPSEFSHREAGKVSSVSRESWSRLSPFCCRGAMAEVAEPTHTGAPQVPVSF